MKRYSSLHRVPKRTRRVRFVDCPRFLRGLLFPGWTKADHIRAAKRWQVACAVASVKAEALRAAAEAEYGGGSPWGPYMTGGTRPHWPQPVRLRILRLAQAQTECNRRALAHIEAGQFLRGAGQ